MDPHEFVSCLRNEILDANLRIYREELERSVSQATVDELHWPDMAELYRSLNESTREQFLAVVRQVMVDTLSNVLGILDGTCILEEYRGHFHLTYGDEKQELNNFLQDVFLAAEEEKGLDSQNGLR